HCHFYLSASRFLFFFFQAEDGIRYFHVTGVQTCALPISCRHLIAGLRAVASKVEGLCLEVIGLAGVKAKNRELRLRSDSYCRLKIGRASCRERVWDTVVDVFLHARS